MKKFLFNAVVYGLLGWSILTGVYQVLPQETKDLIPHFNELSALISGGSAALIGSGGLFFKSWVAKATTESNEKYKATVEKFLVVTEKYNDLVNEYKRLEATIKESNLNYAKRIETLETLLKADLTAKLSNRLIDEEVKAIIRGALNEKQTDL